MYSHNMYLSVLNVGLIWCNCDWYHCKDCRH